MFTKKRLVSINHYWQFWIVSKKLWIGVIFLTCSPTVYVSFSLSLVSFPILMGRNKQKMLESRGNIAWILCVYLHMCVFLCICMWESLYICVNQAVGLFVFPLSRGEQLPLIISNEPAAVKGPSHSPSPERQMNIWSAFSLPLCVCGCVYVWETEKATRSVQMYNFPFLISPCLLFSPFLTFTSLPFHSHSCLHLHQSLFLFTSLTFSSYVVHFCLITPLPLPSPPSSPPVGLCGDRGGQEQVLYLV